VFLQRPVEVGEPFGHGTSDARLRREVFLDNLCSNVTDITFRMHLSKGVLKSSQSILPRGDGAFPAVQLPLPGKKLPL
jgi:hypothetical protein